MEIKSLSLIFEKKLYLKIIDISYEKVFVITLTFLYLLLPQSTTAREPHLLIKIYTKNNPEKFLKNLDKYYKNLSNKIPYHFLITCDVDDPTMNCLKIKQKLLKFSNLTIEYNKSKTTVDAFNSDIHKFINWFDILLFVSDDLEPIIPEYDKIIADYMIFHYPDYDGVLNFHNDINPSINKSPVIGKNFYKHFGYVFNSAYQSSYYDNELTYVSRILGKETTINKSILTKPTTSIEVNKKDEETFKKRRLNTFYLDETILSEIFTRDWSILICSMPEREKKFSHLYNKLFKQIQDYHLEDKIEVLTFKDNKEHSIGYKRNTLLKKSRGMYVNFIDDDDDIHENYIKMIHEKLKNKPDCVSLSGIITFDGKYPSSFVHSIQYNSYFQKNGIFYRPPNHINTIKRSIASQFIFPNISFAEDTNWAMQIANSNLLIKEESITIPYYFYQYVKKDSSNE
ncbi:MAG: hypothetical protein K1060chlam1_00627 [Candidatus Anoxychlamydiales bacterium]|nr:hypothetical protein [Candidatus Anoxychlamydiales bacterium]